MRYPACFCISLEKYNQNRFGIIHGHKTGSIELAVRCHNREPIRVKLGFIKNETAVFELLIVTLLYIFNPIVVTLNAVK